MNANSSISSASLDTNAKLSGSRGFFGNISSRLGSQPLMGSCNIKAADALLLLQSYEESQQGWFWSTDASGNLTYITESVARALGGASAELLGKPMASLFCKSADDDAGSRTLPFILTKKVKFSGLEVQAASSEEECWLSISGRPYHDKSGNFLGFRGSGSDVTAQRKLTSDTSRLAMFDSLTGLANRASMAKKLETTLAAYRSQQRACAVMLVDLDRFKQVNDTLGHPTGDALLKLVAERLLKVVGQAGEVCRLGGDEFQIMLRDCDDRGVLGDLASKIIRSLSQPYSVGGHRCIIGASIGIAVSPFDGLTSEEIVKSSDLALYEAKGNGRGRFRFYSKELQRSAEERQVLAEDLENAITNGELELAYQPIVNAQTNVVEGFETLLRWNHVKRGRISPALFIPIAEEANLIWELGEWVIHQACKDAAQWPCKARVAVNVAPSQFANQRFPKIVDAALQASGLSPERLEIEITEGVFTGEAHETDAMFQALKSRDVRLVLDDFGTGHSSLGHLQTAPFDKIKIDQNFVRGATEPGSRNGAIIAAIVALAEAIGMETTAEGIETMDEFDLIKKLNVSHVQGYVYSEAVSNADLVENLAGGQWTIEPTGPAHHRNDRLSMYRKVRMIHENHVYSIVIRNLSVTGALVEGLYNVPIGTKFVIDFGDGQLAVATVCRSTRNQQGIKFETRLVSDGNGGLCTSRRVSPYLIAEAGLEVPNLPAGHVPTRKMDADSLSLPAFSTVADWEATKVKAK
ncbi:MAG: EAL domain-containing protein [Sphingomonadales bacterium]|nr:EAL domain-containing protein [Sphingomonadales bacterium]NCO48091.1 EAL domain-containing protein [Sphingomonadales bacterium]NCO99661.1 EAL domain-containing protein [Sphingomonadales bacterium]NCP25449.1 EAL domain-containing protein [Sphingomonadales bacterium]NCP42129.1 EAL domain-containing protein [Sphingomonadales bacterium]